MEHPEPGGPHLPNRGGAGELDDGGGRALLLSEGLRLPPAHRGKPGADCRHRGGDQKGGQRGLRGGAVGVLHLRRGVPHLPPREGGGVRRQALLGRAGGGLRRL